MADTEYKRKPLFGGALEAELPEHFADVRYVRHTEVRKEEEQQQEEREEKEKKKRKEDKKEYPS